MHLAQEEARATIASPVERMAESLDEHAEEPERGGGGRLEKAVKGEFGEYEFDDSQLKVTVGVAALMLCRIVPSFEAAQRLPPGNGRGR